MTTQHLDVGTDQMIAYVEDRVGWMIFNNPARRNAISNEMAIAIPEILRRFQQDNEVVVIVMTGAGDKAFVAGRDISQLSDTLSPGEVRERENEIARGLQHIWDEIDKPIIAMIRGYCIGAGLQTAMRSDIRFASDDAKFGIPVAKLGRGANLEGVEELESVVGKAWASEILFSSRHLSAEEAVQIGLINRMVKGDQLENAVRELAQMIAANAPLSLKQVKITLREVRRDRAERDPERIKALVAECMNSQDYVEGKKAFLEKRAPVFRGM